MATKKSDPYAEFFLPKVRISFPALWVRPIIRGQEAKHGGTFLLDPKDDAATIKGVEARFAMIVKEKNKGKMLGSDKLCMRDGDDSGRPEYEGYMTLSSSTKDRRPTVLDARAEIVDEQENDAIYGGCYVTPKVRLWWQDNDFGKRINCSLIAVQFVGKGEPFDSTYVSPEKAASGFEVVDDAPEVGDDIDDEDEDDETSF